MFLMLLQTLLLWFQLSFLSVEKLHEWVGLKPNLQVLSKIKEEACPQLTILRKTKNRSNKFFNDRCAGHQDLHQCEGVRYYSKLGQM